MILISTDAEKDLESQPKCKLVELKDVSQSEHGIYILGVLEVEIVDDEGVCFVFIYFSYIGYVNRNS